MKQFILALGLAGVMVPLVSPTSQQQQQQLTATEPTNADWDWFGRLHRLALDALMPLDRPRGAIVAYRSYHDLDHTATERHFTVSFASSPEGFNKDRMTAMVVVPVGRSIQLQLLQLHMAERAASFESLLPRIAVRRMALTTASCNTLVDRMNRLSRLRISLLDRDAMYLPMHRVWHRVVLNLEDRIDATLGDPDSPLAKWAAETMDALLACGANRDGLPPGVR